MQLSAQQWVAWIQKNNKDYAVIQALSLAKIAQLSTSEAAEYCQQYIYAMIKQDGKKGLLYQEKQMIHELELKG